jgi:hypothetical protein
MKSTGKNEQTNINQTKGKTPGSGTTEFQS